MKLSSCFFVRFWDDEVRKAIKTLREPRLSSVLIKCYGRSFAAAGLFVFSMVNSADENRKVRCK